MLSKQLSRAARSRCGSPRVDPHAAAPLSRRARSLRASRGPDARRHGACQPPRHAPARLSTSTWSGPRRVGRHRRLWVRRRGKTARSNRGQPTTTGQTSVARASLRRPSASARSWHIRLSRCVGVISGNGQGCTERSRANRRFLRRPSPGRTARAGASAAPRLRGQAGRRLLPRSLYE